MCVVHSTDRHSLQLGESWLTANKSEKKKKKIEGMEDLEIDYIGEELLKIPGDGVWFPHRLHWLATIYFHI